MMLFPPRADLPEGFAFRLAGTRGAGDEDEASRDPNGVAFQTNLPDDIELIVFRHGALVFNFSENVGYCGGSTPALDAGPIDPPYDAASEKRLKIASARTTYMNAFIATLWAGGQEATYGFGTQPSIHVGNYLLAEAKGGRWLISPDGPFPQCKEYVPVRVFERAAEVFSSVHERFQEKTLELLPLLHISALHYENLEFSSCLLIGWSVVEALQNRLWMQTISTVSTLKGGHTRVNAERRKRLNGRDYTASVVSQVLSLMGKIDDSRLGALDAARGARNKFAHELAVVSPEAAAQPLSIAASMIAEEAGCAFKVSISYTRRI